MTLPRILIAAEHASRRFGGEAILPYHYFRIFRARGLDVHLLTHERTRAELEELFPADLDRIHCIPDQLLQKLFFRLGKLLPRRVAESTFGLLNNLLTQHAQRPVLRRLILGASVIHQPIPVSPRFPSWLSGLGAPLVIGPLNGGMDYPPAFRAAESGVSRAWVAAARSLSNLANRLIPGKRDAAAILVANARTRAALPGVVRGRVVELAENAVDLSQWIADETLIANQQTGASFVFVGRLVAWKALDLALEALARLPEAQLDVVGDGPVLAEWQALAAALGIARRVRFHGFLPQSSCAPILSRSVALLLPSLYECGGAVVLEAMALGRPVIATAWGGPADYLDASCGILVEPTSREAVISGFAEGMRRLIMEPALAQALGEAGRKRLRQHFDWEQKADRMLAIFEDVVGAQ